MITHFRTFLNLLEQDVDFYTDEVHLYGKGKKHRTSFINAKCHVALQEYLSSRKDESPYLFVTAKRPVRELSKAQAEEIIREIAARSGITKHVTPHILRHTTATQAVANGMKIEEVQHLLGHENVATTMIYVETSQENVRNSHKKAVI